MTFWKRLWWIFGPLVVAGGVLFGLLTFTSQNVARYSLNTLDKASVALESSIFKGRTLKHQALENKEKRYIPFFGSSELTRFDSFHPSVLAEKYDRSYRPFLLGYAGTQSLSQFMGMQPISDDLKNNQAIFIVSPQWFTPKGQNKTAFQNFYSTLQGLYFFDDVSPDSARDRYAAERLLKMTPQNEGEFEQIIKGKDLTKSQKQRINFTAGLLTNEDDFFASFNIQKGNEEKVLKYQKSLPDVYDYPELEKLAASQAEKATDNNDLGIKNSFYNRRLRGNIADLKDSQRDFDYTKSVEYNDFELVLSEFAKRHTNVLFVIPPVNEKWIEYTGLSRDMYIATVKKIKYQLTSQGFNNIADMSQDGCNPYYMQDTIHIGWAGWLKMDTYVNPFLSQKQKAPKYHMDDMFYTEDWAQKDPSEIN